MSYRKVAALKICNIGAILCRQGTSRCILKFACRIGMCFLRRNTFGTEVAKISVHAFARCLLMITLCTCQASFTHTLGLLEKLGLGSVWYSHRPRVNSPLFPEKRHGLPHRDKHHTLLSFHGSSRYISADLFPGIQCIS